MIPLPSLDCAIAKCVGGQKPAVRVLMHQCAGNVTPSIRINLHEEDADVTFERLVLIPNKRLGLLQ
jgi:hypothetical protein